MPEEKKKTEKTRRLSGRTLLVILSILLITAIVGSVFAYFAGYIVIRGPSPKARNLFVRTFTDTMTLDFIPEIYLNESEISQIVNLVETEQRVEDLPIETTALNADIIAETIANTEKGRMVELIDISGDNWKGKMLLVHDPSLVTLATPDKYTSGSFKEIKDYVEENGAVGGITAAGFSGGVPYGYVIKNSTIVYGSSSGSLPFVGFDSDHILHVQRMNPQQALDSDMVCGVCWSPILIENGVKNPALGGGKNPRAAIGQRADGTVLLVVIEGRSLNSFGATYPELAELMDEYGAVNACNLDSGRSSVMVYQGELVTHVATGSDFLSGRELPNAFIVMPEE